MKARLGALVAASLLVLAALALLVGSGARAVKPALAGRSQPAPRAALPAQGGATAAAIWLRAASRSPADGLALLSAAGIPAVVVDDPAAALSHALVIVWPAARLSADELAVTR